MLIRYGFKITITLPQTTSVLTRLDVHPDRRNGIVLETPMLAAGYEAAPAHQDMHGNLCRRLLLAPGTTTFSADGVMADAGLPEQQLYAQRATPLQELPETALPFLLASRYCETDLLSEFAWRNFGYLPEGASRVRAVVEFVHRHLMFGYRFASAQRTANDALRDRVGVCRDFAHLVITLCRCLNVPARYVNGYLGDIGVPRDAAPMDFSAWVEVYLDGRWFTVDARHNHARIGRIVIARGRDATDVPMLHSFGPHVLNEFHVICEETGSSVPASGTLLAA